MKKSLRYLPYSLFLCLSGAFSDPIESTINIQNAINKITRHVEGKIKLSERNIIKEKEIVLENSNLINKDRVLDAALNLIDIYEDLHGPLFINSKTTGGFSRKDELLKDGLELERFMIAFQQAILDEVYHGTPEVLKDTNRKFTGTEFSIFHKADYLRGRKWKTANFFPGYISPPNDSTIEYSIKINATMPAFWGMKVCFADEPIIKPTGIYLSPGGIATVEVPTELVNKSYQIQVGASVLDFKNKELMTRMDRVTSTYGIDDVSIQIANPLGGGIYIVVPYLADDGIVRMRIKGDVVQAPIFSMTSISKTTAIQWNNDLRKSKAPWADFETEYFLMQVPTIWISGYDFEHLRNVLEGHDEALVGVSNLVGVPVSKRNKHLLYLQPDLQIKHDAFGVGYPQVNTIITSGPDGPLSDGPKGKSSHWLVAKPFLQDSICWHELGHCIIPEYYRGETEAIVNFLYAYVKNIHMREEFNHAFKTSQYEDGKFTPDFAAIDWMVTTNFRSGKEMTYDSGVFDQFRYQERGYAKYADIVRLFGWSTFADFNHNDNINYHLDQKIGHGLHGTDRRTLLLSIAAKVDLTPLIHFWGIHPVDYEQLKGEMIKHDLPLSNKVYNLIIRRLTLIPKSNDEFIKYFKVIYPDKYGADCESPHYGCGWYNEWSSKFNEMLHKKAVDAGNAVINKYYSCDDNSEGFTIDDTYVTCKDLLGDYKWACKHRKYSDFCTYSCGVCDITDVSYPTASPVTYPPTPSPTRSLLGRGNISVMYYDVELEELPTGGLQTLKYYKKERVERIHFRVGTDGTFAGSGKKDNVAALFESFLDFSSGTYKLCVISDDGSKLFIDDKLLIDNDGSHSETQKCASYTASSRALRKIRIEYFEGVSDATLIFRWKPPGGEMVTVPPNAFISIDCKDTKGKINPFGKKGKKKITCFQWWKRGSCVNAKVALACPFSCKECPDATDSPTFEPTVFGGCEDTSGKLKLGKNIPKKSCKQLWRKGYCNFPRVSKACPVSCSTCPTSAPTPMCEDAVGKLTLGGRIPPGKPCKFLSKKNYCDFTDVLKACPISCKACGKNNVVVKYYDWKSKKLPAAGLGSLDYYKKERVPNINYRVHVGEEYAGSGKHELLAAMYEFYLKLSAGLYHICLTSDDGSKMYINDSMVIDNDGTHSDGWRCVTFSKPGVSKFRIEYFEHTWDATLILAWQVPRSESKSVIPPEAFVDGSESSSFVIPKVLKKR